MRQSPATLRQRTLVHDEDLGPVVPLGRGAEVLQRRLDVERHDVGFIIRSCRHRYLLTALQPELERLSFIGRSVVRERDP
jgi:hypothetical protein